MKFLYENTATFFIALTVAAFAWIHGGSRAEFLLPVIPWVALFAFEALYMIPQRGPEERTLYEARRRIWYNVRHDPLSTMMICFGVILVIPLMNSGLCRVCDYAKIVAGYSEKPPATWLPFCVNVPEQMGVFLWFLPTFFAVLATRHSLARHGKRVLAELLIWNGVLLAIFGFIQQATGAQAPYWNEVKDPVYFFSTFGYPNMGAAFFEMLFPMAVGIWLMDVKDAATEAAKHRKAVDEIDRRWRYQWIRTHYMLVPAIILFFAALDTLSRAGIILTFAMTGMWFMYIFFSMFKRKMNIRNLKLTVGMLAGIAATIVAVSIFAPKEFEYEVSTITPDAVMDRITGKIQYHARVSWDIFRDYPVWGVGGWGYRHFCLQYMSDEDIKNLQKVGGVNVHNDYLQFLCEHGAVGAILLILMTLSLIKPVLRGWKATIYAAQFSKSADVPHPTAVYAVPAPVLGIMMGVTAVGIHALGDCPLRSPAVLSQLVLMLALAPGYLPEEEKKRK